MADVTLEALRLTKRFGARTAVAELSFTARQGEVVGLLGPNGAGKTTTIRMLTTVLTPSSGEFSVAGIPGTRPMEIRRRVGVLPESAGYPGHQTGHDYLRYYARLFGLTRQDAARVAGRLLTEVGLAERASSRISTYSRGMRQRLGIARALVSDPAVVFLDEPTLGLDPAGQRQVLEIVRDIAANRGATVILSTHTLPEVEEVCTTVLILDRGTVAVAGSVSEVTRGVIIRVTVRAQFTNSGTAPTDRLVADLNVASLTGVYVDLEDWSASRTHELAPLAPGRSTTLSWDVQAVNAGSFDVYVVVLPNGPSTAGTGPLVVSPPLHVTVTGRRTLNAGGALPVVIVMPVLLGLVAAATRIRIRQPD